MATVYKIHPAIGIARIGNSPDEFFIGPERPGEEPHPAGGFKDAQCRVKRQAARFRIFAHHDDGTVDEITHAEADITWTVHLANRKAANPLRGNTESAADLSIDPGPRTLNGPAQRSVFDTGQIKFSGAPVTTVPLGEIRSDTDGRLLVLGGFGHSASPQGTGIGSFWGNTDWFDDISDGPVSATIQLHADHSTPPVVGAWVLATPPKFAPHQDNVITLYDRVFQAMVDGGLATAPTTTSYTQDVYPILQRARDTRWVLNIAPGVMAWPDPVTTDALRHAIFASLKIPGGGGDDMPEVNEATGDGRLTPVQYAHMQRWDANTYTNDWAGPPVPAVSVTPDGMDRAALEACVGGAFFPGIEAGGRSATERPILDASKYTEPLRLNHALVSPGDISATMALPWQADFYACADNWWPVPRPNYVTRGGVPNVGWTTGLVGSYQDMVDKWHQLGFVVRQGAVHVEVGRCDTASINLLTPVLDFQDVPQGPMGMTRETALAISFEVISPSSAVTLQYAPGGAPNHPQLVVSNSSVTVGPTSGSGIATARLWVIYRTSTVGSVLPPQTVTVQDSGGTQSWNITILGNTVARKTAAAALVLDRSGSMSEDRGDGQSKHASLQSAAGIFVDVMLEGDGVGVVRFNQDAQVLQSIVTLGDGGLSDLNRSATRDIINGSGLDPNGATSIGDGIFEGRGILTAAAPFDVKSLVVLTDGVENSPRMIADVAADINEFTYAVGLGQPQNISVPALQTISGNNGGYLLVTGAIGTDNRFLLQKYFLQILAGISNAEIVLDPQGVLLPGRVERVPFQLTAGDAGVDVILLTPETQIVDFRLQTPSGQIIEPWRALSEPGMRFVLSSGVSYYRLALPAELQPNRFDGGGTWYALLTIGRPKLKRSDTADGVDQSILRGMFARPVTRAAAPLRGLAAQRANILAVEQPAALSRAASLSSNAAASVRTVPYSLVVHAYSNLTLQAHADQTGFAPGAQVKLQATLAQSGIPLPHHATVWAEVVRPDGSSSTLALGEHADGEHTGQFVASLPGVYRMRVRAQGTSLSGEPFTREKTLSAAVWRGGDGGPGTVGGGGGSHGVGDVSPWCDLLKCLLGANGVVSPELEKRLRELGIDVGQARKCLEKLCHDDCRCP
jgi:hypothetical protein